MFFVSSLWERDTPMVCMLNHWTGRENIGVQGPASSMLLYCRKYKKMQQLVAQISVMIELAFNRQYQ
jgi:hypothetical protein